MRAEIIVAEAPALAERLVDLFEHECQRAIWARGRFSVALPGGSVATTFFPRLARASLDLARTDVFWTDERAVPPSDPASNYGLARALWLSIAGVPPARVHRMAADGPDLEAAAADYSEQLVGILGTPPRLDVALIGAGHDGHVCSLFPGHAALLERRWVAAIEDAPKPPPRRLTLTLPVLGAAELVVVAALGAAKAEVVREALERPGSLLPLAEVARRARRFELLLDPAAAALLSRR